VFRWGLPASFAFELAMMLLTPTTIGNALAARLAWAGGLLDPIYMLGAN
jgi:hypothetical protein